MFLLWLRRLMSRSPAVVMARLCWRVINERMPVYASFARGHTPHTVLWRERLDEENFGGGAVHEVTCDSYKHITCSSQRRLSISRLREKDGPLLAISLPSHAGQSDAPGRIAHHC